MVWLIGDKGMLGTDVGSALAGAGIEFVGSDREVDILDPAALSAFVSGKRIEWSVNCAASTAVEKAEDEAALCARLNVEGPAKIAALACSLGAKFLHISTDYVFDGTGSRPYLEDDPVAPIGVYGRTKAEGEARVRELCPEHVIVRTARLYGKYGLNFVYTMLKLMRAKERIGVVADQRGTPTHAADLADAIVLILRSPTVEYGTFHFTDLGETTWREFALAIHQLGREHGILERDCVVDALTTAQYPTRVRRPAYSVLSKDRITAAFGLSIPSWKSGLEDFFIDVTKDLDGMTALSDTADYDLESAKAMLEASRFLYVAYCCEQAVEKNLKCLAALHGGPRFHHRLLDLAKEARVPFDPDEAHLLAELSTWYLKGRYHMTKRRMSESMSGPLAASLLERSAALCLKLRKHPVFWIL